MKNSLNGVSFLAPIVAIFVLALAIAVAIAVAPHYKNKSEQSELSTIPNISANSYPMVSANTAFNSSDAANYQNYAMTEPFSASIPFDFHPVTWMQMMNNMMNIMQMNQMMQMMHQMATRPMQMMNPIWMNSHGLPPSYNLSPVQPMDPVEYKKWYEQQLEAMQIE